MVEFVNKIELSLHVSKDLTVNNADGSQRVIPAIHKVSDSLTELRCYISSKNKDGSYNNADLVVKLIPQTQYDADVQLAPGCNITVTGSLRPNSYTTKDGKKVNSVAILANHVAMTAQAQGGTAVTASQPPVQQPPVAQQAPAAAQDFSFEDDFLPFN